MICKVTIPTYYINKLHKQKQYITNLLINLPHKKYLITSVSLVEGPHIRVQQGQVLRVTVGVLTLLHQQLQHLPAEVLLLVVRLPPVQVQVVHPGTLEPAYFTHIRLDFVMDCHYMLGEFGLLWEALAAKFALICSNVEMVKLHMTS